MSSLRLACCMTMSLIFIGSEVSAAALNDARSFLSEVYSHYPIKEGSAFDPLRGSAQVVFDASFVSLLRANARLIPKGYLGAIDWDPFCNCQDDDGMVAKIKSIQSISSQEAKALVEIHFVPPAEPTIESVELDLVVEHGHWRVHDIRTKEVVSLRAHLVHANRLARNPPTTSLQ